MRMCNCVRYGLSIVCMVDDDRTGCQYPDGMPLMRD